MHSEHMRDCEELGCGCEISYFRMEPFADTIRRLCGPCVIVTCECANCECMPLPVNAHNPYDLPYQVLIAVFLTGLMCTVNRIDGSTTSMTLVYLHF